MDDVANSGAGGKKINEIIVEGDSRDGLSGGRIGFAEIEL